MGMQLPYSADAKLTEEDLFKSVDQYEHRRGLKAVLTGPPGSGKTHFLGTCPKPVRIIDTQLGAWPVIRKFVVFKQSYGQYKAGQEAVIKSVEVDELLAKGIVERQDIKLFECLHIDPKNDEMDSTTSLDNVDKAILALRNMYIGTICVDSITDIYPVWFQSWVEATATKRIKSTGDIMQTEWGRATERYRGWMVRLMSRPCHFVATSQEHPARGDRGEELPYSTPHWHKQTPYWVDVVLRLNKTIDKQTGREKYFAMIEKCRWERIPSSKQIEDVTWDKLITFLRDEYGVKVA